MPRALSAEENQILEFVLSGLLIGRDELLAQAATATAEPIPEDPISLRLLVVSDSPRVPEQISFPSAVGSDATGTEVAVLVHIHDGRLYELEFYAPNGDEVYGRPEAGSLRPIAFDE